MVNTIKIGNISNRTIGLPSFSKTGEDADDRPEVDDADDGKDIDDDDDDDGREVEGTDDG